MRDIYARSSDEPALIDAQILNLLLDNFEHRPWSVTEVANQTNDYEAAINALRRLHRSGLIHYVENHVIATRAAAYYRRLTVLTHDPKQMPLL
jgi:predicted transcriptional regulator